MMNTEKIIEKIKKVLELSKNNPSENEAKAAALKAQRLMAEYHISMTEIEAVEDIDNIVEKHVNVGMGNKWKYTLADIIAKNFRCKYFIYGKDTIVFYGYQFDTECAAETFSYLFKTGNKAASNFYMKLRNKAKKYGNYFDGRGIKNCFLVGFLQGISEVLEKQCTTLMIVVPPEVTESYEEMSQGFNTMKCKRLNTASYYASESYTEGTRTGRNAIDGRKIAMA